MAGFFILHSFSTEEGLAAGQTSAQDETMNPLALPPSTNRSHKIARILGGVGAILLGLGVTGPLASVGFGTGFASKTLTFSLVSESRVYVLLALAAATLVLAVRGLTRWIVWSAAGILITFVSMASFGSGEKSSVEMPGWVSDLLTNIAKGAMNLVTFQYGTPCLVLGILMILGVGAWRFRSAD